LARGQDRYGIYCTPCHSPTGDGRGMVALRGFRYPPSFHTERLRTVPDGYIFAVVTNGYGAMPDYSYQMNVHDRWAVTEYVRVLQFSRNASVSELDEADRQALTKIAGQGENR
ncbi:MAG: cytochrome c, partial [Acidobacteriota bacterium]|nr:cytochrome c [Acidobacteriota bacterium]